jgi:hypothetical protein
VILNKSEYAYYRVCEAAAAYFTARLIFAHQEYVYVGVGVGVFMAYEGLKALIVWRGERREYKKLMGNDVQQQQEREK